MNRVSGSSVIAMLKQFLAQLRQWIRQIWRHGHTKNEAEPHPAGQKKASHPTSTSPHGETLETEKAERLSDHDSSAPTHTSAPKPASEAQAPVPKQGQSVQQQQGTQVVNCDGEAVGEDDGASRHEVSQESATVDYTTHERAPVVEEHVERKVHTIYQLERTRSNHVHEHFYHIQPIVDTSDDHDQPVQIAEK